MKIKLFALFSLWSAILSAHAAALPATFVQSISVNFTVIGPGPVSSNGLSVQTTSLTIKTKDLIKALGQATSNSFSANARLLVVAPIGYLTNPVVTIVNHKSVTNYLVFGYPGVATIEVRDGAKVVNVNNLINITTVNNNFIYSATRTKTGGYAAYTSYRVRAINISTPAFSFLGQGLVITPLKNVAVQTGVTIVGYNDNWTGVTGVASNALGSGVASGTISATFANLE